MGDLILGIETSCDETAAAVVERATIVRSSIVSSQVQQHAVFGGVVPEIAGRAHVQELVPVLADALAEAGCPVVTSMRWQPPPVRDWWAPSWSA